jgi:hypothetical protein
MRYAVIENQTVVNIIVADETILAALFPEGNYAACPDGVSIGYTYIDEQFAAPAAPPPAVVPDWPGFNLAISMDTQMIQYEAAANLVHPSIVGKKDLAYSIITDKGLDNFAAIFPMFCQLANVTQEHREGWAAMAESFDLPAEFVTIVRGS